MCGQKLILSYDGWALSLWSILLAKQKSTPAAAGCSAPEEDHFVCSSILRQQQKVLTIIMQENALNREKRAFITEKWCSTYVSHFAWLCLDSRDLTRENDVDNLVGGVKWTLAQLFFVKNQHFLKVPFWGKVQRTVPNLVEITAIMLSRIVFVKVPKKQFSLIFPPRCRHTQGISD